MLMRRRSHHSLTQLCWQGRRSGGENKTAHFHPVLQTSRGPPGASASCSPGGAGVEGWGGGVGGGGGLLCGVWSLSGR